MNIDKFSNALSPLARKDTVELVLSPSFKLHVIRMVGHSRAFSAAGKDFARSHPDHQIVKDNEKFNIDFASRNITPEVVDFLANVIIKDWQLVDDDGNEQPFSVQECIDLLTLQRNGHEIGASIAVKVINMTMDESQFDIDWESLVEKNS